MTTGSFVKIQIIQLLIQTVFKFDGSLDCTETINIGSCIRYQLTNLCLKACHMFVGTRSLPVLLYHQICAPRV